MEELLSKEEALIDSLKEVEEPFLKDLFYCGCLSREDVGDILNLDDSVDSGLKARYLWRIIHSRIKKDKALLKNFVSKLSQSKKSSRLGLYFQLKTNPISSEVILSAEHIPYLTELLVPCCYKWEQIGIGLKLPQHVIEECRQSRSSNGTKLNSILASWQENEPNASLKQIIEVLRSELVGMASLASSLRESLENRIASQTQELEQNFTPQPVLQFNMEVQDGKSALLCVYEPKNRSRRRVKYTWIKDRVPLNNNVHFSNVSSDVLLIKEACQGLKGKYTCCRTINHRNTQKEVQFNITFCPEKECLIKRYVKNKEIPKDSWPPVGNSVFIDLALINDKKLTDLDYSVRGDMDDILKSKTIFKFQELFSMYESGALVLLEGRPGSGKTTLTHKIVREWAIGPDVLRGANFVFLISLRILNSTKKDQTLSEILDIFYNEEHVKLMVDRLESAYGEGSCFIIDGLDEYQNDDSVITRLMNKTYLPKAMIIVASRPVATVELRHSRRLTRRIEVLGFSRHQISSYINEYTFKAGHSGAELEDYLESHINILHMCYLPVHVAMICCIYNECKEIPNTETKIYELFTLLTIKRMRTREGTKFAIRSLKNLDSETKKGFDNICKLAFDMTIASEQSVHQSETSIAPLSDDRGCDADSLGLVTVDSTASLLDFEEIYCFLHLTFQEFLAAFYIDTQDDDKQLDIIKENRDKKAMLVVWKFYCGIKKFLDPHSEQLELIMNSKSMADMYKIQCAFESQQPIVCSIFMKTEILTFEDYTFSPTDFNAIGYVTSHDPHPITLILKKCILHDSGLKSLLLKNIKHLSYSTKSDKKSQLKILNEILKQCESLQTLDLLQHEFQKDDILVITDCVTLPLKVLKINMPLADMANLKMLQFNSKELLQIQYLYNNNESISQKKYLSDLLSAFQCEIVPLCEFPPNILCNIDFDIFKVTRFLELTNLFLINCNMDDRKVEYLLSNSNYETVRLDVNKITDVGATSVSKLVKRCSNLKCLSLSCNMIGNNGALKIAEAVKCTPNLIELDLRGNNINNEKDLIENCFSKVQPFRLIMAQDEPSLCIWDAVTMEGPYNKSVIRAFQSFKYLHTLNLDGKHSTEVFEKNILSAIGKGLRFCSLVKVLILSNNGIRYGMSALARGLKYYTNLEVLDLHNNDIDSSGAQELKYCFLHKVYFLPTNSPISLVRLDLSNNYIAQGAVALASGLECCQKLQSLDLSNNKILSEKDAEAIVCALENCVTLQEFKFSRNNFQYPLKGCSNLRTLYIDHTHMSSSRAYYVFKELQSCANIESLDISHNKIGEMGGVALAEAMKYWKRLKVLKTVNISVKSSECKLYEGLRRCRSMEELDISYNNFRNKEVLLKALMDCLSLKIVIFDGIHFTLAEINLLVLLLTCNESIERVSLKHSMDRTCTEFLFEGLTTCSNIKLLEVCKCTIKEENFFPTKVKNCDIVVDDSVDTNCVKKI